MRSNTINAAVAAGASFHGLDLSGGDLPLAAFCLEWCSGRGLTVGEKPSVLIDKLSINRRSEVVLENLITVSSTVMRYIADSISFQSRDARWQKKIVSSMLSDANREMVNDKDLRWLRSDTRACYWFWHKIRGITGLVFFRVMSPPSGSCYYHAEDNAVRARFQTRGIAVPTLLYSEITQCSPSDARERYWEVASFFTKWNAPLAVKRMLYTQLHEAWTKVDKKMNLRWLKKEDSQQTEWAWEYISKSGMFTKGQEMSSSSEERHAEITLALHLLEASIEKKILFVDKMARAWSQKKFRAKQIDKKALNTHISAEAKDMLDIIVKKRDRKVPDVLESLIKKAYSEM